MTTTSTTIKTATGEGMLRVTDVLAALEDTPPGARVVVEYGSGARNDSHWTVKVTWSS